MVRTMVRKTLFVPFFGVSVPTFYGTEHENRTKKWYGNGTVLAWYGEKIKKIFF